MGEKGEKGLGGRDVQGEEVSVGEGRGEGGDGDALDGTGLRLGTGSAGKGLFAGGVAGGSDANGVRL